VTESLLARDNQGRVVSLAQLTVAAGLGTGVAFVILVVIDGVFAAIGLGSFGQISGWLSTVLPALLFFDDLRAWRGHRVRVVVALVAAAVGFGLGLAAASIVRDAVPVVSGTIGALVAAVVYSVVWFVGIRWFTGSEMGSRQ
jgi:hypothetical protein